MSDYIIRMKAVPHNRPKDAVRKGRDGLWAGVPRRRVVGVVRVVGSRDRGRDHAHHPGRWRMTAPLLDDQSLAALAFLEAVANGEVLNWGHMLDTTSHADMIVGLARVGAVLAHELAVNTGTTLDEVFEVHRGLFLHYGNPRSQP